MLSNYKVFFKSIYLDIFYILVIITSVGIYAHYKKLYGENLKDIKVEYTGRKHTAIKSDNSSSYTAYYIEVYDRNFDVKYFIDVEMNTYFKVKDNSIITLGKSYTKSSYMELANIKHIEGVQYEGNLILSGLLIGIFSILFFYNLLIKTSEKFNW